MGKFIDLTGQKFGKLKVLQRIENNKNNQIQWLCKCDCGNYHKTTTHNLRAGSCKSCGCINANINKYNNPKCNIKVNKYDLSGEYGIGYTSKGTEFYFDLEDFEKIFPYNWHTDGSGYIIANSKDTKEAKIRMHRLVMGVEDINTYVDHIYHNKADNRKSQLRIVTNSQNQMNKGKNKNNTSGTAGVYWHKNSQKWESIITLNGKLIYLGIFDNYDKAVQVRKEAEEKYFGEFRYKENVNT